MGVITRCTIGLMVFPMPKSGFKVSSFSFGLRVSGLGLSSGLPGGFNEGVS